MSIDRVEIAQERLLSTFKKFSGRMKNRNFKHLNFQSTGRRNLKGKMSMVANRKMLWHNNNNVISQTLPLL